MNSFPVPPEVGKIGKDSPTFIQPVSERTDGIKSFFQKQATSPAKSKSQTTANARGGSFKPIVSSSISDRKDLDIKEDDKEDVKVKVEPMGVKAEGIGSDVTKDDHEIGLGDDSNAPKPGPSSSVDQKSEIKKEERPSPDPEVDIKVEGPIVIEEEDRDTSTSAIKRKRDEKGGAGHRTKVIRREGDDGPKAVCPSLRHCDISVLHREIVQKVIGRISDCE